MPDKSTPLDGKPWPHERMARQAPTWAPSGVIGTPAAAYGSGPAGLSFAVAGSVITVALAVFRGIGRGFLYERTETPWQTGQAASGSAADGTESLATPAYQRESSSNPRIDRLVLRRDLASSVLYPYIIQGAPAAVPQRPALVQNELGVWDTPLFSWQLAGGNSTSISNIVDERLWVDPGGDGYAAETAAVPFNANYKSLGAGTEYGTAGLYRKGLQRELQGVFTDAAGLTGGAAQTPYTFAVLAAADRPLITRKFSVPAYVGSADTAGSIFVRQNGNVDYLLNTVAPTSGLTVTLDGVTWRVPAIT